VGSDELPTLSQSLCSCAIRPNGQTAQRRKKPRKKEKNAYEATQRVAYLLVTKDPLDVPKRLPASDDETVLDGERYRASDPFTFSDIGISQHIVGFRHTPEYAVLLWQQCQMRRGTNAMEYIWRIRVTILLIKVVLHGPEMVFSGR
jgi:hypothetical protein